MVVIPKRPLSFPGVTICTWAYVKTGIAVWVMVIVEGAAGRSTVETLSIFGTNAGTASALVSLPSFGIAAVVHSFVVLATAFAWLIVEKRQTIRT